MKIVEYGKQNRDVIMLLHGGGLSWWRVIKDTSEIAIRLLGTEQQYWKGF